MTIKLQAVPKLVEAVKEYLEATKGWQSVLVQDISDPVRFEFVERRVVALTEMEKALKEIEG